ncbi:hypothetical protein GOP47_0013086 [Adiantum capillus-veneris]|uniref:non-specific serine/threonine protein kinase n=1 Tax=Adiantum capillus-veneris TaxID=13818 RepID=A0A9D4USB6_ADICA|nr:hypothetical protein GOP47_0013086 [Adiantum capillus-veneris]
MGCIPCMHRPLPLSLILFCAFFLLPFSSSFWPSTARLLVPSQHASLNLSKRTELTVVRRATLSLSEADALLQLKNQVQQDPEGALANWRNNTDLCNWTGVQCNADEHVQNISLPSHSLSGALNFFWMSALPLLQNLDLSDNELTGNLSSIELGSCRSLQLLNLAKNRLSEPGLPASLLSACNGLVSLNLSENEIPGKIPASFFSSCGALQELDLSGNKLSGWLPGGVEFCLSLLHLNLARNSLDGNLPPGFLSNCSSAECNTGPRLLSLDISRNNISGSIPDNFFANCQAVVSIDLSSNLFSGSLPSSLQNCKNLAVFNITANSLLSELPKYLGQMASIQKLHMANNHFTGQISSALIASLCTTLQDLDLSTNNLSGPLPASFESCKSLQSLKLQKNKLDGDFPSSFFSPLQELEVLRMGFNAFTGPVPVGLMNCSKLKVLDFGGNQLTGFVPEELCVVPPSLVANGIDSYMLEQLLLPNNKLSGPVPVSLSNCTRLLILNLSFNRLSGTVPMELSYLTNLERLSLWYNQLTGSIPSALGNLTKLRSLNLNNNQLSGDVPVSISRCTNLEWLNLNNNLLTGTIPRELGLLQSLTLLELGNNSLTGVVPQELGNCSQLLWLDLNTNFLSGSIPTAIGRRSTMPLTTSVLAGHQLAYLRNAQSASACRGFGMGFMVDYTGITTEAIYSSPFSTACQIRPTVYSEAVLYDNPENHTLQYLDLSFNQLSGSIPSEMGLWISLIILGLSHNKLTGALPSSFSKLAAINVLDISYNQLEGSLAVLSGSNLLVGLDVSNNRFSGEIPGQLSTYPPESFVNNTDLCGLPLGRCDAPSVHAECNSSTNCPIRSRLGLLSMNTTIVLAVLVTVLCVLAFVVWMGFVMKNRNQKKENALLSTLQQSSFNGSSSWNLSGEREPLSINVATFERPLRKLTFSQLIEATNGFSRESLVGTGGFGEVYKAELRDGTVVAIKKLLQFSHQGDREFVAEMETLGKIKHRNLVPLLGYCKVGEERLLVYEYMHGGSLEEVLHGSTQGRERLNWETRKQIAKGAARGLAFLHHNCIPHIIHRDMKSSNVLLDKDLTARVSDFGMARLISALDTHLSVSTLAGTPGYVPPEYYQSFRCTTKGDIYSFGVVLLELVTGKRPTDKDEFGDNNLVGWVKLHVASNSSLKVLDPSLRCAGTEYEMVQYLKIACDCLDDIPSQRPSMLHVIAMFKEVGLEDQSRSQKQSP